MLQGARVESKYCDLVGARVKINIMLLWVVSQAM